MGLLIKRTPSSQTGFSRIYEIIMKKTIYVLQCSYIMVYGFTTKMNPNLTAWIHEVTYQKKLKTYMTKIEITMKKNPNLTAWIRHKLITNYTY
jgi:hypothetical protein